MSDAATAGPPASVEVQDPLPESTWLWRRVYVFVLTTVCCVGVGLFAGAIADSNTENQTRAFLSLARWTLLMLWFVMTYYLIAPSAEHVTRMWQTASVLKSGVGLSSFKQAVAPDGSTATAQNDAGIGVGSQAASTVADGPDIPIGSPGGAEAYAGPPVEDLPTPDASTPEDAQWPR